MSREVSSLLQVPKKIHCIIHNMEIRDILVEAKTKNYFDVYFAVIFGFVTLFLDFLVYFILLKFWVWMRPKEINKFLVTNKVFFIYG